MASFLWLVLLYNNKKPPEAWVCNVCGLAGDMKLIE
jgi:hypothetical protein